MARAHALALLLVSLLVSPLLAGCLTDEEVLETVTSAGWEVGDRWVYLRTSPGGSGIYTREVTGLLDKRDQAVFEVTEGLVGHPIRQYSLYTVGQLRFMGMEVHEGDQLRTRTDPETPLTFHYPFPLEAGRTVKESGRIHQTAGDHKQVDTVEIEATVKAPQAFALGERVYDVYPYEIRIHYTTTPFSDVAVIEGHWAPTIGQSVLTRVSQGGETRTYELLSFTRATTPTGGPLYGLTGGLESRALERGFQADLEKGGYERYLFHVERPTTVGLRFFLSMDPVPADIERMDLVALRPLGYARTGLAENVSSVTEPGVALHLAARRGDDNPLVFHSPGDGGLERIDLIPGHVYEFVVASNIGPLSAEVLLGPERETFRPVETGKVDVLAVAHKRQFLTSEPGPQNYRDSVQAVVAVPEGTRVEGLVFAVNRGGEDRAIGEVGATRRVTFETGGFGASDPDALYGYYLAHDPGGPFTVEAAYEYRAEMALRGVIDYEVGALLMRLVDGD